LPFGGDAGVDLAASRQLVALPKTEPGEPGIFVAAIPALPDIDEETVFSAPVEIDAALAIAQRV